ncbi:MAG: iron-containing alcohol dehydrogenase [Thermoguttaceae bacterium]
MTLGTSAIPISCFVMLNFTYYNPTKIVFGRGAIAELRRLVPADAKVLILSGGGSIHRNGVYDQVVNALRVRTMAEFRGIEPNPRFETCMKAVELVRSEGFDFLLAVGGGSVLDGTKFVAAAAKYRGNDPWDMFSNWARVPTDSLPVGCVMTLPATGSEMNGGAVISREATQEKLYFTSPHSFPRFSILDPETTFSLPPRQTANGIVDAFIHTMEQYLTYPAAAPLQDRQAEAILLTLVEEGPKALAEPDNYDVRATIMWCATQALNGLIGCGVPQDWAAHGIGHELTALYGIDHAQSLAIVHPGVLHHQRARKQAKLLQAARRVWQLQDTDEDALVQQAIEREEAFFRSLGVGTRLSDYDVSDDAPEVVAARLTKRRARLGEHGDLGEKAIQEVLASRR